MKGQAVNDLPLSRDKLGKGQKCVQRPWGRGHGLCEARADRISVSRGPGATVSQIMETLRVGSHSRRSQDAPVHQGLVVGSRHP